jgi:hypothetical protein
MAKLWSCGWNCAGFAMCAGWVGLTFGLDMSKSAQIRGLVGEIEVTGVRFYSLKFECIENALVSSITVNGCRF